VKHATGWRPTPAHLRAVLGSVLLCAVGVLARRPDLLVIVSPLAATAVWAIIVRPTCVPTVTEQVGHLTLREGEATTCRAHVEDPEGRVEDVAVVFECSEMIDQQPEHGQVVVSLPDDGSEPLQAVIRPRRWGTHRVRPALVVASSGWNGFRCESQKWSVIRELVALPHPAPFDATAPAVHTPGLIGGNRSPHHGGGTEFATVRPFQPGDRLRRIHWVESLRSGTLHVTSTWADHDRNVVLLVDAFEEVGISGGVDGDTSSLDIAVRAAAAIAEHYITSGDRVAVVPLGAGMARRLPPASGRGHLRRILEVLARIEPADSLVDTGRIPHGLGRGALIIVLSPLLSAGSQQRLAAIADHGYNVVAIDCLPALIGQQQPPGAHAAIAWRITRLEREARLRRVSAAGIAVVPWHGPGSLDPVLRGLHRRTSPSVRQP
jgi:uncharacterized protein (DUF58 family)